MLPKPPLEPTLLSDNQPYQRLQALYDMAVELSALRSLESVLDTALQHCLALTESQFGFVGLTTPNGQAMDVVAINGFHPSANFYKENHIIPLRPSIFARAVLENCPIASDNAMIDPTRLGQPKGHPPVQAFLGVPLRIRDKPIGMIGVANRPFPYNDEHEQLLMTYAAQVAIVIRNAQLYEQLKSANEKLEHKVELRTQQLEEAKEALADKAAKLQVLLTETFDVQERERQRIAQDMHDGMNQLLIGAMLELKSAHQRLANENLAQAEDSLQTVQTILRRVEQEIKHVIYDLRPPTLDALGLAPAVRRYGERFEGYTNIPCKVVIFGEPRRLRPSVEISVYRLLQEALQNVSSHAQAMQVDVIVAFAPHKLKLTILDDGCGFDLAQVEGNGNGRLGLLGMRERAESLGGRVAVETAVGQGTRVELVVPIEEETGD
ncbi:MAG: GAF domain-containing sensor histidine kinase [Ardenticatenaceae bacterium]|nr:GAF domain-containing sensor histidine kinase [Ardenticatenaceae bacterium]